MNERDLGSVLLAVARGAIAQKLGLRGGVGPELFPDHAALTAPGATFVTLKHDGELRGCIGSIDPIRPLGVDVCENAMAAAFRDPRFPPLTASEYAATSIEVSLLSPCERIDVACEEELCARLRPGLDGVILELGTRRATFLPQVWASLPDPRAFIAALKRKAGLPEHPWNPRIDVFRYHVNKWAETGGAD